jgi:hypothetical protein
VTIDEAEKRTTEFLEEFLRNKAYFRRTLSEIEPEIDRAPIILQQASRARGSETTINVSFTLHKFFDPDDPPKEVSDAVDQCMTALKQLPELAPFEFQVRLAR